MEGLYFDYFNDIFFVLFFVVIFAVTSLMGFRWGIKKVIVLPISILLALAATIFVRKYLVVVMLFLINYSSVDHKPFEMEKWKSDPDTRYEMVDDLLESKRVENMSKTEVKQMLGEQFFGSSDDWNYSIGAQGKGFHLELFFLNVRFKNDTVQSVKKVSAVD